MVFYVKKSYRIITTEKDNKWDKLVQRYLHFIWKMFFFDIYISFSYMTEIYIFSIYMTNKSHNDFFKRELPVELQTAKPARCRKLQYLEKIFYC